MPPKKRPQTPSGDNCCDTEPANKRATRSGTSSIQVIKKLVAQIDKPSNSKYKVQPKKTEASKPVIKHKVQKTNALPTKNEVDSLLKSIGIIDVNRVSLCLKAGIKNGFIKLTGKPSDLDMVIFQGKDVEYCPCGTHFVATLRSLLYQPINGGNDYDDGLPNATVKCSCTKDCDGDCDGEPACHRIFVKELCYGNPHFDDGKYYNHCTICPNFGVCIGDYRESHCEKCKGHYFAGIMGSPCDTCYPNAECDDYY